MSRGDIFKMADANVVRENTPQQDDVLQGDEPGASANLMLISTDSYEDLENCLNDSLEEQKQLGLSVGTINRIAREGSKEDDDDEDDTSNVEENNFQEQTKTEKEEGSLEETMSQLSTDDLQDDSAFVNGGDATSPETEGGGLQGHIEEEDDESEDVNSSGWRQHRKHIFILSSAGKPIYSRYGKEDKLVTVTGVIQALVSFVQMGNDLIRCIVAGEHRFVFLVREHLILVAVSKSKESLHQLLLQLNYVYNQVLSVLTYSQMARIFKQRRNYDLRRLLTGAEKFFDHLLNLMDTDASFLLGAVRCLPLPLTVRDTIAQTIVQYAKVKDLVFAILVANNQLITLIRMKKYFLHPMDLHIIFNLVGASESFKAAESWTPICLPKFDSSGYLHAHVSYLDEACHTCLLLLTVDRDVFFTLSECKQKILDRLNRHNCLQAISESVHKSSYSITQVGIPDLRHFMYKAKSTAQYTSPCMEAPYNTEEEQERLFALYQYLHQRIHSTARPLKILYHVGAYETLLGWTTSGFELYAVFSPLVTKPIAINSINKLLKWIKKEEDTLFILNAPTF